MGERTTHDEPPAEYRFRVVVNVREEAIKRKVAALNARLRATPTPGSGTVPPEEARDG